MNRSAVRRNGYALLETIVAMVVLSIGILAVNQAMRNAVLIRAQARDYTRARFYLEDIVSRMELQPVIEEGTWRGACEGDSRFQWEVKVTTEPPPLPKGVAPAVLAKISKDRGPLRHVRVTLRWTRAGQPFHRTAHLLLPAVRPALPGESKP